MKYCQELEIFHQKLLEKWPALVNRKGLILLHDNARPHVSIFTQKKLKELKYEILPHSPYSQDLTLTDYHLFKHLNHFLQNKSFFIPNESRKFDIFSNGIFKLLECWQKCVDSDGSYFD